MIPLTDLRPQLHATATEITQAISRVLDRGWFLRGPEVEAFEQEWAAYCGQRYCVACASGTDALTLAALAPRCSSRPGPGEYASPNRQEVSSSGAQTILVGDVDNDGRLLSLAKSAVPVLLYGRFPSQAELSVGFLMLPMHMDGAPPRKRQLAGAFIRQRI